MHALENKSPNYSTNKLSNYGTIKLQLLLKHQRRQHKKQYPDSEERECESAYLGEASSFDENAAADDYEMGGW